MKLNLNYKKIISEVITASLIIIISAIAIYSFIVISDQDVDVYSNNSKINVIKGSSKIEEVLSIIQNKYMEDVDIDNLIDGAINGIFDSIEDPYTRYLTAEEYSEMLKSGNEEYTGIGVHISRNIKTGEMIIISVMPNSPAKEAGIISGDVVLKLDDKVVTADNYSESVDYIKGEEGTTIKLLLKRDDKEVEVVATRKKISANNVESMVLDGNIGYIKILEFENNIYNQFKEQYEDLINNKKVKALIIDVRDNPGGIVTETVKIADLMCKEGKILETVYRDGTKKVYMSEAGHIGVPLVVLVNENSASAAEILAGAIKDLKQGTLIGKQTFGKGIVQSVVPLESGGAVSVTTARYYTASGIEIHGNGIAPDVVIENDKESRSSIAININTDAQLREAVNLINQGKIKSH